MESALQVGIAPAGKSNNTGLVADGVGGNGELAHRLVRIDNTVGVADFGADTDLVKAVDHGLAHDIAPFGNHVVGAFGVVELGSRHGQVNVKGIADVV